MTTTKSLIESAIARSISHDEIVHLTIPGDSESVLSDIDSLVDSDTTEVGHVEIGADWMEVWGFNLTPGDGWRLTITFAAAE